MIFCGIALWVLMYHRSRSLNSCCAQMTKHCPIQFSFDASKSFTFETPSIGGFSTYFSCMLTSKGLLCQSTKHVYIYLASTLLEIFFVSYDSFLFLILKITFFCCCLLAMSFKAALPRDKTDGILASMFRQRLRNKHLSHRYKSLFVLCR